MKKKKGDLLMILTSVIVICINNISLSKYDNSINAKVHTQFAKAIVEIEKDEIIKQNIREDSFPIEYNFSINNYKEDIINEVDFDYVIEIECSNENFPVNYYLFDCNNNKEINLVDGKSEKLKISKNVKESRKFKLYLEWREMDGEIENNVQLKLKVNAVQGKGGESDKKA